jgi:integrase
LDDALLDFKKHSKVVSWAEIIDAHLRPFFGELRASNVGTNAINAYVEKRLSDGVKPSTINRELARLRRAFRLGAEAEPPKVKRVPLIKAMKEPPPRRGFFEWEDFVAVRRELPEPLRPLVTFLYYTGCRVGETVKIRWPQVDFAERSIRLEPGETKNEEARELPLIRELYVMLVMQKQLRDEMFPGAPWVFSRLG